MRLISIATLLATGSLALAPLHAQAGQATPDESARTSVSTTAPDGNVPPPPPASVATTEPATVTSRVNSSGAVDVTIQNGAVVQNAPPPAANYPRCTATLRDSCTNNPAREANAPG